MRIVRDEQLVKKRKKIGQIASLSGLVILILGMVFTWMAPRWGISVQLTLYLPFAALLVGFILSNVGIYYTNRWVRSPRPDEILDTNLKGLGREYVLYHYALPVPHLLLTPGGPVVLAIKTEAGEFTLENGKWKQKFSVSRMLRFMGQEGLGNPDKEAQYYVDRIRRMLEKCAPDLVKEPIDSMVVFLAENVVLNIGESEIPILRAAKLKGYLRSQLDNALPKTLAKRWEEVLDAQAGVKDQG